MLSHKRISFLADGNAIRRLAYLFVFEKKKKVLQRKFLIYENFDVEIGEKMLKNSRNSGIMNIIMFFNQNLETIKIISYYYGSYNWFNKKC